MSIGLAAGEVWRRSRVRSRPPWCCAITIVGGAVVTILPIERSGFTATIGLLLFGVASAVARWQAGVRVDRHGVVSLLVGACALVIAGVVALVVATVSTSSPRRGAK